MIKIEKKNKFIIFQILIFTLLQSFNTKILAMTESEKPSDAQNLVTSTSAFIENKTSAGNTGAAPVSGATISPIKNIEKSLSPVSTTTLKQDFVETTSILPLEIQPSIPVSSNAPIAPEPEVKAAEIIKPEPVVLKPAETSNIETSRVHAGEKNKNKKDKRIKDLPEIEIQPGKILVDFTFNNEDLTTIISKVAKAKDINIILPLAPNNIMQKVSFGVKGKITIDQAWEYLLSMLELSGYSVTKNQNGVYTIVKNNQNVSRENMPLYVNVLPERLPYTDQRIRYVYYLSNMRVPEMAQGPEPLNLLLKEIYFQKK